MFLLFSSWLMTGTHNDFTNLVADNGDQSNDLSVDHSLRGFGVLQQDSSILLVEPRSATNRQLPELLSDPIRHSIEFLMTLAVRLIEECLL